MHHTHVLLNLLTMELGKRDKCEACSQAFISFLAKSLIDSIIQEHEC